MGMVGWFWNNAQDIWELPERMDDMEQTIRQLRYNDSLRVLSWKHQQDSTNKVYRQYLDDDYRKIKRINEFLNLQ